MNLGRVGGYGDLAPLAPRGRAEPAANGFADSLEQLLERRPEVAQPHAEPTDNAIRFSRHAKARLESRGIEVTPQQQQQLGDAIDRLHDRGAKKSLVLLGDNAWVVGIPSRTVITVMPRAEAMGTIFTNIDSTFVAS